ncbi:UNVERIFIED_CONTAM: hypothetical protein RMT77_006612 [Armadillidium vulgare]
MDNYIQYGTPLESLDENNFHLSKAPKLSDQVVTDKQGKRRFHGAFTGGFSAGYFNSVGTKEGWTPSTFVSSRSKRAEQKLNRDPVSFMDEEDISYFGIASRKIQTSSKFEDPAENFNKRKRTDDDSGPIPGQPVLHDLLKPVNMTMGMKFLIKLGWRPGQGIGPRLSKQAKIKARRFKNANSCTETQNSTDSDDTDTDAFSSLDFAPDDVEDSLFVNIKSDLFGLGYEPLERTNVLGFNSEPSSSFRMTEKNKKLSIRGQAFGVGAFEEEDEDIYTKEDMSDYDFDLGPSKSNTDKKRFQSRWDNKMSSVEEALEGFHLSSKPLEKPKKIPLPSLPSDYKPWHEAWKSRFDERKVVGKDRLTSDERKHLVNDNLIIESRSGIKTDEEEKFKEEGIKTSATSQNLEASENVTLPQYKPFASYPEKQRRYELYTNANCIDKGNIFPSYMTEWEREREKGEFQRAQTFNRPLSFSMSSRFTSAIHKDSLTHLQEGFNDMKNNKPISNDENIHFIPSELPSDMKAAKQKLYGRLTLSQIDWVPDKLLCKRFNVPNPFVSSSTAGSQSKRKNHISLFSIIPETPQNNFPQVISNEKETSESADSCNVAEDAVAKEEDYGLKVPVGDHPTIDLYNAIFQDSSDSESDDDINSQSQSSSVNQEKLASVRDVSEAQNTSLEESSQLKNSKETSEQHNNEKRKSDSTPFLGEQNSGSYKSENSFSSSFSSKNCSKSVEAGKALNRIEAKGIFKGIDFSALNQYRNVTSEESSQNSSINNERGNSHTVRNINSENSSGSDSANSNSILKNTKPYFDSEEEEEQYGPSLPPHMVEGIKTVSNSNTISTKSNIKKDIFKHPSSSSLLEIEKKLKKLKKQKKKHKHKHKKHKKESKLRK